MPRGDYKSVIEFRSGKKATHGNFVDTAGNVLGEHSGIIAYTIGQRKGLGLSLPEPMYVIEKNSDTNEVVLGTHDELYCKGLVADNFSWVSGITPDRPVNALIRTRYNSPEVSGVAEVQSDGEVRLTFASPHKSVAPGQAVVLYDGDLVLGGGTIKSAIR